MVNRYINRYTLALFAVLLFSNLGYSQVKLDAPTEAATGKKIVVKVLIEKGKDLKLTVLKDGKEFKDYLAFKDLADDKPILLITETEDGVYTVLAAVNDANKTYTALSITQVGKPKPTPDPKVPDIVPDPKVPDPKPPAPPVTGLNKEVKDLYTAAPDAATLDNLIQVFTDIKTAVGTGKYKTFGDFETSIAATANDRIKDNTKLRKVRDRLGDYLIEKTGTDPRAWNATKATQVCDDVLAALNACK